MIDRLWNELVARIPWHVLIKILKNKNIPTAMGKFATKEAIDAYCARNRENSINFKSLKIDLRNYIQTGDKVIRVLRMPQQLIDSLQISVSQLEIQPNIYSNAYPYLIDNSILEGMSWDGLTLSNKSATENSYFLTYSSRRKLKEKVSIKDQLLQFDLNRFLDEYDEVYGYKSNVIQLNDIIHFDFESKIIEIRIDNSKKLIKSELNLSLAVIENLLRRNFGITEFNYYNFYNVINSIYNNSNEGRIVEYGFMTDTESFKEENYRNKKNVDLRTEDYHVGGKANITAMTPFKLSVRWKKSNFYEHEYELELPGSRRLIFELDPLLQDAIIHKCINELDLKNIVRKLISLS